MITTKSQYLAESSLKRNEGKFYILLLVGFAIACASGLVYHEMWRDEVEAWLIARDSNSIRELFSNLTYTGHPFLWYFCLYLLAKLTHNPAVIQIFHLVIISGAIYLFIYFAPFDNFQKALFCFSYFPLYEYGIISRGYSLGMLLLFAFCTLYCQKKRNSILIALALALVSQTNIYALIIGFVLALVWFYDELFVSAISQTSLAIDRKIYLSLGLYLCSLLSAIAQIISARSALSKGELGSAIASSVEQGSYSFIAMIKNYLTSNLEFEKVLAGIWRSYVPIPSSISEGLWSTNFLTDNQSFPRIAGINTAPMLAIFLSFFLFFLFAIIFKKQPRILFIYVGGTFLIYLFGFIAKIPSLRHNGHLFILLIICLWLFYNGKDREISFKNQVLLLAHKHHKLIISLILTVQFYVGVQFYLLDLARPFSNIHSVAEFIQKNQLEDYLIFGTSDLIVFPISAWLNRQIYYLETNSFKTFTVWTPKSVYRNSNITKSEIIDQAKKMKHEQPNSILVADKNMQLKEPKGDLTLISSFKEPSMIKDKYFIYSVD